MTQKYTIYLYKYTGISLALASAFSLALSIFAFTAQALVAGMIGIFIAAYLRRHKLIIDQSTVVYLKPFTPITRIELPVSVVQQNRFSFALIKPGSLNQNGIVVSAELGISNFVTELVRKSG